MTRRIAAAVVLVLVAAAFVWARGTAPDRITVTATFPSTIGLYPGDDVRVVGVPMGTINEINPQGGDVEVVMELDPATPVAPDTGAVIVPPGVLSSRYVQLTKPWLEGPRLGDGDRIDAERTAAPLELDDVTAELDSFVRALGPKGANRDGALSDLVDSAAGALDGNGATLRQTLTDVADALDTMGQSRGDIVTTIEQLQTFVTSLAGSDRAIRSFERNLGVVTTQLAGQRRQLRATVRNIGATVRAVRSFVRENGDTLTADVRLLRRLSTTLADRQRDLMEIADLGPIGTEGIFGAANLETGVLDARVDLTPLLANADTTICQLLEGPTLAALCPPGVPDPPGGAR
ncbi:MULTISPECIES: MCE family protein [unclassified Nocardioides]|uniref:MCE family protein n=1 Tax=unclassified Nocardioides TaxID=2615069 RepID=UPI00362462DF